MNTFPVGSPEWVADLDKKRRFALAVFASRPPGDPRGSSRKAQFPVVAVAAAQQQRPRERREQRHAARSTSSGDSGDDGPPPPSEECHFCGTVGRIIESDRFTNVCFEEIVEFTCTTCFVTWITPLENVLRTGWSQ